MAGTDGIQDMLSLEKYENVIGVFKKFLREPAHPCRLFEEQPWECWWGGENTVL